MVKLGIIMQIGLKSIAYACFMIGIWLLVRPVITPLFSKQLRTYKNHARLRRLQLKNNLARYRGSIAFYRHFDMLLGSTWPWYSANTTGYYIILTLALFSVNSVISFKFTGNWVVSAGCGILAAFLPYIFLTLVLHWKRSETSYELIPATGILLGKYRVNSKNIYFAILETIKEMGQQKVLQKSLIKLAAAIQSHKNKEDLENSIDLFVYQIGTSWAKQIGVQILTAQWENKDIERSLSNIVRDMGKAQEIMEQQKSVDQDTVQMGYFVPLIAFPASLLFLSKVITSGRYLYYQFKTTTGFTSFIITFVLCLIGFIVSLLLRKPKNEI